MITNVLEDGTVFVAECAGDLIKIVCKDNKFGEILTSSGFVFEKLEDFYKDIFPDVLGRYFVKKTGSEQMKADELGKLRDVDVPFAGGKEWNPQEVFEYLRDHRLLNGEYKAIDWLSPDRVAISIR